MPKSLCQKRKYKMKKVAFSPIKYNPNNPFNDGMPAVDWKDGITEGETYDWHNKVTLKFKYEIKDNNSFSLTLTFQDAYNARGGAHFYCLSNEQPSNKRYYFTLQEWSNVLKNVTMTNGTFSGNFIFAKKGSVWTLKLVV